MKWFTRIKITNFIRSLRETGELDIWETKKIIDGLSENGQVLDELLTREEVAGILKVSPKTISRWTARGKLRRYSLWGNNYRYLKSEIMALIKKKNGK